MKTEIQVEDMLNQIGFDQSEIDSKLSGMSYADGLQEALRWVNGELSDSALLTGEDDDN